VPFSALGFPFFRGVLFASRLAAGLALFLSARFFRLFRSAPAFATLVVFGSARFLSCTLLCFAFGAARASGCSAGLLVLFRYAAAHYGVIGTDGVGVSGGFRPVAISASDVIRSN
jgi:hypothetical protein